MPTPTIPAPYTGSWVASSQAERRVPRPAPIGFSPRPPPLASFSSPLPPRCRSVERAGVRSSASTPETDRQQHPPWPKHTHPLSPAISRSDHPRSGGGRLAPSIANPPTSHPPGELRQAAVGHALTAGETETPHPGRRNTICVPAASSNPNHGAPQPTRFAVTSLPCAPKTFCFSRLVSSDCGTSKTGRVGSRAEEACGTKSVVSGIPS